MLALHLTIGQAGYQTPSIARQAHTMYTPVDRAEKRLRKSMSCGNDCGLRRGLIQNGGLLAGKKQLEFKMKK